MTVRFFGQDAGFCSTAKRFASTGARPAWPRMSRELTEASVILDASKTTALQQNIAADNVQPDDMPPRP